MEWQKNYSIKQIKHYFSRGGEAFQPFPEKGPEELLAEGLRKVKEDAKKQKEFNQALGKKLDEQQKYIEDKLEARDRQLMQALNEIQEVKKLI